MANPFINSSLEPIGTDDFLPPVNWWVTIGSWFVVFVLGGAIVASFFVKYRTTVNAPAIIRPIGESRLVQSILPGTVVKIAAAENETVTKGSVIAYLDTSSLDAKAAQLLANFDQGQLKLEQLKVQMATMDRQITAEADQAQRTVAASAADFEQIRRSQQDRTVAAQSDVLEARAQVELAAQEVQSYSQLVDSGAVSRLQLAGKEAALKTAQARTARLESALNPSSGDVSAAQQKIAQAQASGVATLARLQQSRQELAQQALNIQEQLQNTEQEIAQVMLSLENSVVRSPIDGVLYELSVRNIGQVLTAGETIAKVIPAETAIHIKAMIPVQEINKIDIGMPAQMHVSACPFSQYGTLPGKVSAISPDTVTQQPAIQTRTATAANKSFYSVLIQAKVPTLASTTGNTECTLQPGVEGRVTIISREETVITFLRRKAALMPQI